jgi:hypothetical protein
MGALNVPEDRDFVPTTIEDAVFLDQGQEPAGQGASPHHSKNSLRQVDAAGKFIGLEIGK